MTAGILTDQVDRVLPAALLVTFLRAFLFAVCGMHSMGGFDVWQLFAATGHRPRQIHDSVLVTIFLALIGEWLIVLPLWMIAPHSALALTQPCVLVLGITAGCLVDAGSAHRQTRPHLSGFLVGQGLLLVLTILAACNPMAAIQAFQTVNPASYSTLTGQLVWCSLVLTVAAVLWHQAGEDLSRGMLSVPTSVTNPWKGMPGRGGEA